MREAIQNIKGKRIELSAESLITPNFAYEAFKSCIRNNKQKSDETGNQADIVVSYRNDQFYVITGFETPVRMFDIGRQKIDVILLENLCLEDEKNYINNYKYKRRD